MHDQTKDRIRMNSTNTLSETPGFQVSSECDLDEVLMSLIEQMIAQCDEPRYKFLNYLLGMAYLEASDLARKAESISDPSFQTAPVE